MTLPGLIEAEFECPVCGETNEILIDPTGGEKQQYIEDCSACCNPVDLRVHIGPDAAATISVSGGGG